MASYLLQENGDRLILEDGSGFIILEDAAVVATTSSSYRYRRNGARALLPFLFWLAMAAQAFGTDANLTWAPNTEADLAGYKVYRLFGACGTQGPPTFYKDVGNVTSFLDQNLDPSAKGVMYALTAYDTTGNESDKSTTVCKDLTPLLPPPTNFLPASGASIPQGSTKFTWGAVPGAAGYKICIHLGGTPYDNVCKSVTTPEYTTTLVPGSYDNWVLAVDPAGKDGQLNGQRLTVTQVIEPVKKKCSNLLDDDNDGKIDMADPGCSGPDDDDETNPVQDLPPAPPKGLQVAAVDASNVQVSWQPADRAVTYTLKRLNQSTGQWIVLIAGITGTSVKAPLPTTGARVFMACADNPKGQACNMKDGVWAAR